MPFPTVLSWGRALVFALAGSPFYFSCTPSEDTEPFVPAVEGAKQPNKQGALISADEACRGLLDSAKAAYIRLGCDAPQYPACPSFIRPGGGSGCYQYYKDSVDGCKDVYDRAESCRGLSPCLATAEYNGTLDTCGPVDAAGMGGMPTGGAGSDGGPQGGAPSQPTAGAPAADGGTGPAAGQPAGGAGG